MCRLLGFAAATDRTTRAVLGGEQSAVFQDMSTLHRDGWGSAWLDETAPAPRIAAVRSHTSGEADPGLTASLTDDEARARITHLRMASDGMLCSPENTHPFVADGVAFAHNGALVPSERMDPLIAPEIAARLTGTTDSERYFAVIRTRLAEGLDLPAAVRAAVADLRPLYPTASLNALVLSADRMIAVHASEGARIPHDEFDRFGAPLPRDHREGYYLMRGRRLADGTVVFASSGLDITGWTPLPAESIVTVDLASLAVDVHAVEVLEGVEPGADDGHEQRLVA